METKQNEIANSDKVAVKVVDRAGLDARALRMLSREVSTLECVHHPNILRLFEVVETLGRVYLVTEWVRGGEMYNHITQGGPLREVHASPLYKQLLLAVKHMHSLGFVHRDIKAENVLLVSESQLKLADFGFSTQLLDGAFQKLDTFCGSPPYAAPELFSDDHYLGGPVDCWALGVLLYFMVVGNMPFRAPTVPALRSAVLKGEYQLPAHLTLPCQRLIQRILIHLPARRPTIEEILNSQWIQYPNLSIELMNQHISLHSKPKRKSSLWFRSKSRRMHKSYSIRDRYMEMANKTTIPLNTKKNDGTLVDNFLHPIEINHDKLDVSEKNNSLPRRSFFSGTLKKKVSPMESEKEKSLKVGSKNVLGSIDEVNQSTDLNNHNNYESKRGDPGTITLETNSSASLKYDEEKGKFIMLPTDTDVLEKLKPLEIEARFILEELGVTSEMLRDAIKNGPRSDVIGAYRIVINRLQKQAWIARKQAELAAKEEQRQISKRDRKLFCTIL